MFARHEYKYNRFLRLKKCFRVVRLTEILRLLGNLAAELGQRDAVTQTLNSWLESRQISSVNTNSGCSMGTAPGRLQTLGERTLAGKDLWKSRRCLLKRSGLIWRLRAAAGVDPEHNDNTCRLELQIRSLQFQTPAHPAVRDSGVRPRCIHHA